MYAASAAYLYRHIIGRHVLVQIWNLPPQTHTHAVTDTPPSLAQTHHTAGATLCAHQQLPVRSRNNVTVAVNDFT